MTLIQANALIRQADALFQKAANAWVRGNNSGDSGVAAVCQRTTDRLRDEAEMLLAPLGIECDYPGLYPSFKVCGYDHHSTESAVSAALAAKGVCV